MTPLFHLRGKELVCSMYLSSECCDACIFGPEIALANDTTQTIHIDGSHTCLHVRITETISKILCQAASQTDYIRISENNIQTLVFF